jgi:curved DNA-binding protein CbpA
MSLNPYAALGLPRDATPEQVNEAYRRQAKAAHPDQGGTVEEFTALKRAHLVLSDPGRRAKYDRTGEVDDGASNPDVKALEIIMAVLSAVFTSDQDVLHTDLRAIIVENIQRNRGEPVKALSKNQTAIGRARRAQKRFIKKGDGENIIARMIGSYIADAELGAERLQQQIAILDRALEIVQDYRFDPEAVMRVMPMGSTTTSTFYAFR